MSSIATGGRVAGKIELMSAWIEWQLAYAGLPGLSIGIVYDQELIWARGFGFAHPDKRIPATPTTLYRIASISKTFTATAVLQLRDRGLLHLDDPVEKHLSWFKLRSNVSGSPPVTIRHLITHTSGLPREADSWYWTDAQFPTRAEVREGLTRQDQLLRPETQWKYSNLALALAGEVVEAVSKEKFADFMQRHILKPLGMAATRVESPAPDDPALAAGFGRRYPNGRRAPNLYSDLKGMIPCGNMTCSVEDLSKFVMLQFRDGPAGGAQILKGDTLREMQRVHWLHSDWQQGWGLGFAILRQRDVTYVRHGGWVSGFRSEIRLSPAQKVGVVVLTSADDGNPDMYAEKVFQWVAPALSEAAAGPAKRRPQSNPNLQRYSGRFRDQWSDLQVLVANGELVAINLSHPDPIAAMLRLIPTSEHHFRVETADMYGPHGEDLEFVMDGAKVAGVKFAARHVKPIEHW
jgi:D-alanyl-D-alanine carboxypeptidase